MNAVVGYLFLRIMPIQVHSVLDRTYPYHTWHYHKGMRHVHTSEIPPNLSRHESELYCSVHRDLESLRHSNQDLFDILSHRGQSIFVFNSSLRCSTDRGVAVHQTLCRICTEEILRILEFFIFL